MTKPDISTDLNNPFNLNDQEETTPNLKTLVYNLDFQEPVSRQKYLPNASPTDLLIDNFNILLEGTQPDIEVLQQITTTVISKTSDSIYKLTITLNHEYFTNQNKIKIEPTTNKVYDRKLNEWDSTKEITLDGTKPAIIKQISLTSNNNEVTFTFSEQVCKINTTSYQINYDDITIDVYNQNQNLNDINNGS